MDSNSNRWPRFTPLTPSISPVHLLRSSSTLDLSSFSRSDSPLDHRYSDLEFSKAPPVLPSRTNHPSLTSGAYPSPPSFVANTDHFIHGHKAAFPQSHPTEELSIPQTPTPIRDPLPNTFQIGTHPSQPKRPPPPHLRITPPRHIISPPTENPRPGTPRSASSRASQVSLPDSDDSFSDIFYKPRQSLEEPSASPSFYLQGPSGTHAQSSTDLAGPLLEDYYNNIPGGFNPAATSTPERSEFSLGRPGHPSSLPLPIPARPLFFSEGNDQETQPVAEPRKRKGPSFSSLRKWLPRAQEVDVEREADGMPSLADSSRRSSSDGRKVTSAPSSPSTVIRSSFSSSSSARAIEMDVFSSNPLQPSYYPSPSPPKPPTPTPSLTLTSVSTLYASPQTSPTMTTPKAAAPYLPETIYAPYDANSSRSSLLLTPSTPTPRTRHKRGALSQRFNALSVIEGSPNSEARYIVNATDPTSVPGSPEAPVSTPGSPNAEDELSLHQQTWKQSWRSTTSTTRMSTSSLHGMYQKSKGWLADSGASISAHSSLSIAGVKGSLERSRADEEFHSRSETHTPSDLRVLRSRQRWNSDSDDEVSVADVVDEIRQVEPSSPRGHRHAKTEPLLLSERRELVLPQLTETHGAGPSKNRLSSSVILTPSPSPAKLVIPRRKVRIATPRSTSPTFEQQQRRELQRRLDDSAGPGLNSSRSSNPTLIGGSDSAEGKTVVSLMSVIGMIFRHPLSAVDLLPPAQVLFLLGFVLGPWAWLVGGWIMTPDGQFHTVDREGVVIEPSPFAKNRSATSVATPRSTWEDHGSQATAARNNLTLEALDSQYISAPNASRTSLASAQYSRSHRNKSRLLQSLRRLSGLFPLSSDSPSEWVWKCRIAALGSAAVILVAFVLACYAANYGHF